MSATASITPSRVAVRGVDDDDVAPGAQQRLDPLVAIGAHADRGAARASRPSSSLAAFGCCCAFSMSLMVMSPASSPAGVDHQQLLDPVAVQELLRPRPGGPLRTVMSFLVIIALDRLVEVPLEAQVAVGEDADRPPSAATTGRPEIS